MAEEITIERVVPEIRSICSSSKDLLEVGRMSNDFHQMMGYEIPWQNFGFKSLKSFLKSRPDDFRLQENAFGETFIGVVVKGASEHIVKMVASQKRPLKRRNSTSNYLNIVKKLKTGVKQNNIKNNNQQQPQHRNTAEKESTIKNIILAIRSIKASSKKRLELSQLTENYRKFVGHDIPWKQYGYKSLKNFLLSHPSDFRLQKNQSGQIFLDVYIQPLMDVVTQKPPMVKRKQKTQIQKSFKDINGDNISIDRIIPEIRGICISSKDLLDMQELDAQFQKMLGYQIPWQKFGFDSLQAFLKSCPNDFVLQENGFGKILVKIVVKEATKHLGNLLPSRKKVQNETNSYQALTMNRPAFTKPSQNPPVVRTNNPEFEKSNPLIQSQSKSTDEKRSDDSNLSRPGDFTIEIEEVPAITNTSKDLPVGSSSNPECKILKPQNQDTAQSQPKSTDENRQSDTPNNSRHDCRSNVEVTIEDNSIVKNKSQDLSDSSPSDPKCEEKSKSLNQDSSQSKSIKRHDELKSKNDITLADLYSITRFICDSSKAGLTLNELSTSIFKYMGCQIYWRQYGFESFRSFIKSHYNDFKLCRNREGEEFVEIVAHSRSRSTQRRQSTNNHTPKKSEYNPHHLKLEPKSTEKISSNEFYKRRRDASRHSRFDDYKVHKCASVSSRTDSTDDKSYDRPARNKLQPESFIQSTEKVIRGIMTMCSSSNAFLEIRRMSSDFQKMFGYDIPYQQYGFSSLVSFLRNHPSCFQLHENSFGEIFIEIVAKDSNYESRKRERSRSPESSYRQRYRKYTSPRHSSDDFEKTRRSFSSYRNDHYVKPVTSRYSSNAYYPKYNDRKDLERSRQSTYSSKNCSKDLSYQFDKNKNYFYLTSKSQRPVFEAASRREREERSLKSARSGRSRFETDRNNIQIKREPSENRDLPYRKRVSRWDRNSSKSASTSFDSDTEPRSGFCEERSLISARGSRFESIGSNVQIKTERSENRDLPYRKRVSRWDRNSSKSRSSSIESDTEPRRRSDFREERSVNPVRGSRFVTIGNNIEIKTEPNESLDLPYQKRASRWDGNSSKSSSTSFESDSEAEIDSPVITEPSESLNMTSNPLPVSETVSRQNESPSKPPSTVLEIDTKPESDFHAKTEPTIKTNLKSCRKPIFNISSRWDESSPKSDSSSFEGETEKPSEFHIKTETESSDILNLQEYRDWIQSRLDNSSMSDSNFFENDAEQEKYLRDIRENLAMEEPTSGRAKKHRKINAPETQFTDNFSERSDLSSMFDAPAIPNNDPAKNSTKRQTIKWDLGWQLSYNSDFKYSDDESDQIQEESDLSKDLN